MFVKKNVTKESKSRKLIFESLQNSKIVERLDVSDKFWQEFKIQDVMLESRWDCMRLKIVIIQITVNPKEYFKKFKNRSVNKKLKGVRRDTPGMNFESYAERIKVLREVNSLPVNKRMIQKRL